MLMNPMSGGFVVFETPIGSGGISWSERGVSGIQMPEPDAASIRARLQRRFPQVRESLPPPHIQHAIDEITRLLRGESSDLSFVDLDVDRVPPFERQVYELARRIPPGETLTYGQLATRLGDPLLARDVGQALARNPFPIVVPCHRVVAAGGKLGGFSARGGVATKQRLLAIERANVSWQLPLNASVTGSA
jgi:methylated-DNA-[protein]-cysteine S-methyltransferase